MNLFLVMWIAYKCPWMIPIPHGLRPVLCSQEHQVFATFRPRAAAEKMDELGPQRTGRVFTISPSGDIREVETFWRLGFLGLKLEE